MSLADLTDVDLNGLRLFSAPDREERTQQARILAALGLTGSRLPCVDEESLGRYYEYLSAKLLFPFDACYPESKASGDNGEYRCTVLELLCPSKHLGDEFDGIFCRTRKAGFAVNLPLVELEVARDSPNFQLIEDYWYWFWNWRCP